MPAKPFWPFLAAAVVVLGVSALTLCYGLGSWSWDVDEVETLHELRLFNTGHPRLDDPASQAYRLPRLVPIWYACQGVILNALGVSELNARLLSVACGLAAVFLVFLTVAGRTSVLLGAATALVMATNPLFITLVQQNRYYSMAVLFQVAATAVVLFRPERGDLMWVFASALLAVLAVLSHNVLLIYFCLAALAAGIAFLAGWCNRHVLARAVAQALAAVAVYLLYIRPIIAGWNGGGEWRDFVTVWLSFVSDNGIPVIVLAFLGAALALRQGAPEQKWWAVQLLLCGAFVAASPLVIYYFNYRYALLFLLPFWMLAGYGVVEVARTLRMPVALVWVVAVVLLVTPKVVSHMRDGSRKDFRQAAAVLKPLLTQHDPVCCNMQSTLWYYLPNQNLRGWPIAPPREQFFVVLGTSAWEKPLIIPGRQVSLIASIAARRLDEQSYHVWIYRVDKAP